MKIVKGLLFLIVVTTVASCFDPPEFPDTPSISFENIEFYDGANTDSLVIYFNFRDGNGDLGLNSGRIDHISAPFHNLNFYQTTGAGQIAELITEAAVLEEDEQSTEIINILNIPSPSSGKLVFPRTRKQPGYSTLPAFRCQDYEYTQTTKLYIRESDWAAVTDNAVLTTDTVYQVPGMNLYRSKPTTSQGLRLFEILDTLLISVNPNHFNLDIDFLVRNSSGGQVTWTEYDWRKEFCMNFDARFPELTTQENALEGTIRYSMNSLGFVPIFGFNKTLKLRIQIKDRALNLSPPIESREFTLDQILVR